MWSGRPSRSPLQTLRHMSLDGSLQLGETLGIGVQPFQIGGIHRPQQ